MKAASHLSTSVDVLSHLGHVGLSGTVNLKMFLKDVNLYVTFHTQGYALYNQYQHNLVTVVLILNTTAPPLLWYCLGSNRTDATTLMLQTQLVHTQTDAISAESLSFLNLQWVEVLPGGEVQFRQTILLPASFGELTDSGLTAWLTALLPAETAVVTLGLWGNPTVQYGDSTVVCLRIAAKRNKHESVRWRSGTVSSVCSVCVRPHLCPLRMEAASAPVTELWCSSRHPTAHQQEYNYS